MIFAAGVNLEKKQTNENAVNNLFYLHAETTAKMYQYPLRHGFGSNVGGRGNWGDSSIDFPYGRAGFFGSLFPNCSICLYVGHK